MHTLFDSLTLNEVIYRIDQLKPSLQPRWGKMSVSQMMAHCQCPLKDYFGETRTKRGLMSLLFGKIAKKKLFSDKPWPQNLPTAKTFVISDERAFEEEKVKLIQQLHKFSTEGTNISKNTHPFFGNMSSQEWGIFAYKHLDHHLKQFGV
jgi:hypothetical protein